MPQNPPPTSMFDVESIRRDFPILRREVHGKPLTWLDSAATAQKPQTVIDRVARFYEYENALEEKTEALSMQHDTFARNTRAQLKQVFDAIRELMTPPEPQKKRPIGFISGDEKPKKD